MAKIDTRKQTTEIQQHNRDQAIRLHSERVKRADIARIIGVHTSTLGAWTALYNKGGVEALKIGARGRRTGEGRRLSEPQENKLREIILDKFPDQMKLPFALWSSTAIRSLIADLWGIEMGQRTLKLLHATLGIHASKGGKASL